MRRIFHDSVTGYSKDLAVHSARVTDKFEPGTIHELRTSFKKLRALLRWQKVNTKILNGFEKIYAAAGEMRNVQVVMQFIEKEKTPVPEFENWLSVKLELLKKNWAKEYQKKIIKQLREDIKELKIKPTKHKSFFSKRIKRVRQIIDTDIPDIKIHSIRKIIKDIQYVLECWQKNKKNDARNLFSILSIDQLQQLAKQIGQYNDKLVLLVFLSDFMKEEKRPELINKFNSIIAGWQQDKDLHKKKLLTELQSIKWWPPSA